MRIDDTFADDCVGLAVQDSMDFFLDEGAGCSYSGAVALDMEDPVLCMGVVVLAVDVDECMRAGHHIANGLAALADDEADCISRDGDGDSAGCWCDGRWGMGMVVVMMEMVGGILGLVLRLMLRLVLRLVLGIGGRGRGCGGCWGKGG